MVGVVAIVTDGVVNAVDEVYVEVSQLFTDAYGAVVINDVVVDNGVDGCTDSFICTRGCILMLTP